MARRLAQRPPQSRQPDKAGAGRIAHGRGYRGSQPDAAVEGAGRRKHGTALATKAASFGIQQPGGVDPDDAKLAANPSDDGAAAVSRTRVHGIVETADIEL